MLDRKQRRSLRREIRREAIDYVVENPDCTYDELKEHLESEFAGLIAIDPITISIILAIIKMILDWFNKK